MSATLSQRTSVFSS